MDSKIIDKAIIGIILLVVLFQLYSILVPELEDAGDTLNESGVPFGSFFASGGIVYVIIMASLVILVVRQFTKGKNK